MHIVECNCRLKNCVWWTTPDWRTVFCNWGADGRWGYLECASVSTPLEPGNLSRRLLGVLTSGAVFF